MDMFCFQCQETAKGTGCTRRGVCGKEADLANIQDLLIYTCKGISVYSSKVRQLGIENTKANKFIIDSLFMTITNANFEKTDFINKIREGLALREEVKAQFHNAGGKLPQNLPDCAVWEAEDIADLEKKANSSEVRILATEDEDKRSLRELLTYGIKGMAAYTEHAFNLGYENTKIYEFIQKGLVAATDDTLSIDDLVNLVMECGKFGVEAMSLLDKANTETYGNPEVSRVNIGVRTNPGILISGHDLKDMEELNFI